MKKYIFGFILLVLLIPLFNANAYVNVKGYYRSNGTYVAPHVRSNPNGVKFDNYSYTPSQGLYNPSYGTRDSSWDTPTYITDPDYYIGKSLYQSGSTGSSYNSSYIPTITPSYSSTYVPSFPSSYSNSYEDISGGYKSYGVVFCDYGYYEKNDSCKKAPKNGYAFGSENFYCDYGYEKSGSKCLSTDDIKKQEEKKNLAKKTKCEKKGNIWYDNSCMEKLEVCQFSFGSHSTYVSGENLTDMRCSCEVGYKFSNTLNNSCIKN
jgi:hypothetical protein